MNLTDTEIASSPAFYPHSFDARGDRVMLVKLSAADYRLSSFLDSRMLAPGMTAAWFDYTPLAVSAGLVNPRPLHMIFHTGHVGSTLLSRLLDEVPGTLGLREPHPLQTLADMADETPGGEAYRARLGTFLRLWSRGFEKTQTVVLKATSIAGRIAPDILAALPSMKAVYLNLPAQAYITAILAAASGMADLKIFEALRHKRLSARLGRVLPEGGSAGELAAIAWMVEQTSLGQARAAGGERVMLLDFDHLLGDLEGHLAQVLRHFDLPPVADRLVKSPSLTRYSKAPEQVAFSPETRATLMRRSRDMHAEEIEKGVALIGALQPDALKC
ncbi:MAG TPA: hypothetical protein VHY57_05520 [Rhizomicrobium sp.]|nr:hypothetical protein [Rhizomicrobium sp.]